VLTPTEAKQALQTFGPITALENIPVAEGAGRILAHELVALEDMPHFHRASMDGYAVRAADTFGASASQPGYLSFAGSIEMGDEATQELRTGKTMRIATGGMLPPGADAVVMVEYSEELIDGTVEIQRSVSPGQHVLRIGDDTRRGDPLFPAGRRLRAQDLGALCGAGMTTIPVIRRPRVALLSTGDEIVPPSATPRPGQVRNVNQVSLLAMIREAGGEPNDLGLVSDRPEALRESLEHALSGSDLTILSGGSSVGTKDMALDVIASFPESTILFHGISYAPGKPTILASTAGQPILGLPGHPVSALITFRLFGAPLVRMIGGEPSDSAFDHERRLTVIVGRNLESAPGREDYVRVTLDRTHEPPIANPLPGKSGAIFSLVRADGMIRIPLEAEGLEAGEPAEVILF
jgi:molybdopterin molybdotransferase